MSMYGANTPKQRIYEDLQSVQDEFQLTAEQLAALAAQVLAEWLANTLTATISDLQKRKSRYLP